jgi:hypothetical protein
MEISDYKSGPLDVFQTYTGTGTNTGGNSNPDYSYDTVCGVKFNTNDGRVVTLVRNAGTALVSGVLVQTAAETTAWEKLAITVPAATPATAGTTQILVTNGATALKQGLFNFGYAIVASGTGIGQTLQIANNPAAAASANFVLTLIDPIQVTLDATSTISLVLNPYQAVIIAPSSETGAPVGATFYPIAASTLPTWNGTSGAMTASGTPVYGYVVTHGVTGILVDNTVTNVGYSVGRSAATPGAVGVETLTTVGFVGTAMQTLTSAQVGPIYLNL